MPKNCLILAYSDEKKYNKLTFRLIIQVRPQVYPSIYTTDILSKTHKLMSF